MREKKEEGVKTKKKRTAKRNTSLWKKNRKKRGEDTEAATRGGDLWWDYRWRYFFITVSPGCFSFLFFVVPTRFGWLALSRLVLRSTSSVFPSSTLPISPYDATVYTLCSMLRSARGGLYLNNIHELRYTRQIYCSDTRGFSEAPEPTTTPLLFSSLATVVFFLLSQHSISFPIQTVSSILMLFYLSDYLRELAT